MSATEPTLICPKCRTEIKLTESLAAPLVESIRRDYEERLMRKDTDMVKRETVLRERETAIAKARDTLDDKVAEKMKQERARISAEEARRPELPWRTTLIRKRRNSPNFRMC